MTFLKLHIHFNIFSDLHARLVGNGDNDFNEGRVEIDLLGKWGTICNHTWNIEASHVICKMLGHEKAVKTQQFGQGREDQNIWLDHVLCKTGCEKTITDCRHSVMENVACKHTNDVGVVCLPKGNPLQRTSVS